MSARAGWGTYALKPWFVGRLRSLEDALVRRRVPPDHVTIAAVVVSVLAGAALAFGAGLHQPLIWLAVPPLVVMRLALNALDGSIARRTGTARPFGLVVNEVSDRVCDAATIGALAWVTPPSLAIGAVASAFFVSTIGLLGSSLGGTRLTLGPMGKSDRALVIAVAAAAAAITESPRAFEVASLVIIAGCAVTAVRRVRFLRREVAVDAVR
ncbi:MAG: CDP-alcohol phosphatidyltransferase family protein [Actinomycetota bacterium]|nr:CDP-alcohol phosphatidyltransferase family protein [Actinomycetota bacterium]